MRSKAFFINGGAGRVICSIPGLEKYAETHDDFVIVCEGGMNFFRGHPVLHEYAYDMWHKGLFKDKLKDRDCESPEPYRRWHYYNQKCSLTQAYDMEINGLDEPRELPAPNIKITKTEGIGALNTIEGIKDQLGKEKCVIFQPFGRGVQNTDGYVFDPSSRSFNMGDVSTIINDLKKDYAVIVMSEFPFDVEATGATTKHNHAIPQVGDIRLWAPLIANADHFIGCDSVGQHIARSVGTTATVVVGSTFPINISYPNEPTFDIFDIGAETRTYSPLRMTGEDQQDMENDECMTMTKEDIKNVIDSARKRLGKPVVRKVDPEKLKKKEEPKKCCDNPAHNPRGFGS